MSKERKTFFEKYNALKQQEEQKKKEGAQETEVFYKILVLLTIWFVYSMFFTLLWNLCIPGLFELPNAKLSSMLPFTLILWTGTLLVKSAWK